MSNKNTHLGEFVAGRGYRFFVSTRDLVSFRAYIAKADAGEREYYGLASPEELTQDGANYFLGLHRTEGEMKRFEMKWFLAMD